VLGAALIRAELDELLLGDHVLREILATNQNGLLLDQLQPVQSVRQRLIPDGLFFDDQAVRLRELVASIGLFLRSVPAATEITTSGVIEKLLADGLFLIDQAVKLVELRQRTGILVADTRLSTLERALADGTLFAEQQGLLREVLRQTDDSLFIPDIRSSVLNALLVNSMLLDDSALAQYFPELIEALTGIEMRAKTLLGERVRVDRLLGERGGLDKLLSVRMGGRR
jgi:hypothetical protein